MEDWKQLAEYVKSGSESAFESVVNEHLQMVYATALRKTGNRDAAEEVTQSTFIVLTEKAKTLTPSGSLGAWLHRTALLKSKERIKKDILQAERLQKLKEHGMPRLKIQKNPNPCATNSRRCSQLKKRQDLRTILRKLFYKVYRSHREGNSGK